MEMLVMVRSAYGKPLLRMVIGVSRKLAYVPNNKAPESLIKGAQNCFRFQLSYIFQYDDVIYSELVCS